MINSYTEILYKSDTPLNDDGDEKLCVSSTERTKIHREIHTIAVTWTCEQNILSYLNILFNEKKKHTKASLKRD